MIRKFVDKFSKFTMQQFVQNVFVIYLFNSLILSYEFHESFS